MVAWTWVDASSGSDKKIVRLCMVYAYILEVDPIGFITALDMRSKRIKEVTNASKDFGLSI